MSRLNGYLAVKEKFYLPTNADYRGAILALHRLEDVYSLEPSDFRTGNLSKDFPSRNLNGFIIKII
jgi:hypothetical protein